MFVIPMAGLSSRFFKAGYDVPKYQLTLDYQGQAISVFELALRSFERYFDTDLFVIILRDVYGTRDFVEAKLRQLGVKQFILHTLDDATQGQAETVYLGLQHPSILDDEPVYIFNIDTFRYDYQKPDFVNNCSGYLEVFRGEGEHWSFIAIDEQDRVTRTTEKQRISELCSDGLYYFANKALFDATFTHAKAEQLTVNGEYYIAPLYNQLIEQGHTICYQCIGHDDIDFCGTPAEYQYLQQHGLKIAH